MRQECSTRWKKNISTLSKFVRQIGPAASDAAVYYVPATCFVGNFQRDGAPRTVKINRPNCGGKFNETLLAALSAARRCRCAKLKAVFCGDRRSFAAEQTAVAR